MDLYSIDGHLRIEKIKLSHAEIIFNCIDENREHLRKWLPFIDYTQRVRDTELFIRSIIDKPYGERDDVFVIWYKNEFAGLIGFKDTDFLNYKTEIGYWLAEKMTGKGIALRSVKKLVNIAFRNLNMNRVQIRCGVGNNRSAAIPIKLGFRMEGIERDGERHSGKYIDLEVYSLLKKEWIESLF
ncbi:MAG: GNAT family protein [Prolixibacteraceae bacterium]|jgi:ribosomal-protein-serine acetyltransferase|nr:GNAT family protein [Prolixibacteraceae bacterium]